VPIRTFDAGAPESVFTFLDERAGNRGAEHWRWKYRIGGHGRPAALYWEEDGGRIAGFIGMMHTQLESGSERAPAAWFVDWHVDPGSRSVGVGMGLLRKAEAASGSLLTLQGSADTREILPKLGWQQSLAPALYVRPLSRRYLSSRLASRLPAPLRPFAGIVGLAAIPALKCADPSAPAGIKLEDVARFPAEYDRVWTIRAQEFAPSMTRDSAYLNYFCADYPGHGYGMQLLHDGNDIVGHLVLRIDRDREGLGRGRIVDMLWPRSRRELAGYLLRSACAQLQRVGADYVEVMVSSDDVRESLPRLFRQRRVVPIWYHVVPPTIGHPDTWYITFLDCDRAYR
jgi:hypothetical protein